VNCIEFLVFFYTNFPKDYGKALSNTAQKYMHFTVEYLTLFVWQNKNQMLRMSYWPK